MTKLGVLEAAAQIIKRMEEHTLSRAEYEHCVQIRKQIETLLESVVDLDKVRVQQNDR